MKKIFFNQDNIFEIAKFIKTNFPQEKIFIYKDKNKLILKVPNHLNKLKLEEIKCYLKTKYPLLELKYFYY